MLSFVAALQLASVVPMPCALDEQPVALPSPAAEPRVWLTRVMEQHEADRTYRALHRGHSDGAEARELPDLPEQARAFVRELRLRPRLWSAKDCEQLATWLQKARPFLEDYRSWTAQDKRPPVPPPRPVARGIHPIPHLDWCQRLGWGLLADAWDARTGRAGRLERLHLLLALSDSLAKSPFPADMALSEEMRDDALRSVVALWTLGEVERATLRVLLEQRDWVEREDLRGRAGIMLDAVLAADLAELEWLTGSASAKRGYLERIQRANEERGGVLSPQECEEAAQEDPGRWRAARVALSIRAHEAVAYCGSPDNREWFELLEAVAIAESKAPALTRLLSLHGGGAGAVMDRLVQTEARRRGRLWVRAVLGQAEKSRQGTGEQQDADWFERPFWLPRDPYGQGNRLLVKRSGEEIVLYSRGPDGSDNGGDAKADLVLFELSARALEN